MTVRTAANATLLPLLLLLAGCMVGPDYHRPPPASVPAPRYTELPGWAPAAPADAAPKGDWWIGFNDPLLNELEPRVRISNQTVRADYQNYQQALALVRLADSELFPTIGVIGSVTRSRTNFTSGTSSGANVVAPGASSLEITQGAVEGTLSWELDIWGQVRRTIEETEANAQASEATLANATLSAQITLATTLINLRATDANIDLLRRTVVEYTEYLRVVSNAVEAGYSLYPPSDEAIARVQLENARASLIALGVARAQYAHAIAVLVGMNPEDLDIPHSTGLVTMPEIPVGVPSTVLERRPDIAAAERTMAAQNAAIGVAVAAYYPEISLSAAYGFAQGPLGALFSATNTVWSIGAAGTETIFDFGQRAAQVAAAKAAYESAVANYRATVLSAFQGVEDNLAALRVLAQEAEVLEAAVRDARRGAEIARNEYLAGTVDYTTVATAQATELSNEQMLLYVQQSRLVAAATLIGDLGGGWSQAQLHDASYLDKPGPVMKALVTP
jgi:NodT family efflux transporter outer membrane factor (OMF) lipoprotein